MATFKEAFREARNAGKKTFMWNGKPYTTELKEEAEARKSKTKPAAPSAATKAKGRSRPDETARAAEESEMTWSDIPRLVARGMMEGAERVPAGRGLGAMFVGGSGAAAARGVGKALSSASSRGVSRAKAAAERIDPSDFNVEIKPAVFRRLREEAKDPFEGRRVGDVSKELKEQAQREAERAATKRATQFRSRTADRMDGFAKGGLAKKKRKK